MKEFTVCSWGALQKAPQKNNQVQSGTISSAVYLTYGSSLSNYPVVFNIN